MSGSTPDYAASCVPLQVCSMLRPLALVSERLWQRRPPQPRWWSSP